MPIKRRVENHRRVNVILPECGLVLIDYPPKRLQKAISRKESDRLDREAEYTALGVGRLLFGVVILLCVAVILILAYIMSKGI